MLYTYLLLKTRNISKLHELRERWSIPSQPVRSRYLPFFFQQLSYWLVNQLSEWVFAPFFDSQITNYCWFVISCYIMLYPLYFDIFCLCNPTTFSGIRGEVPLPYVAWPQESLVSIQLLESPRNQWRFSIAASKKSYPMFWWWNPNLIAFWMMGTIKTRKLNFSYLMVF